MCFKHDQSGDSNQFFRVSLGAIPDGPHADDFGREPPPPRTGKSSFTSAHGASRTLKPATPSSFLVLPASVEERVYWRLSSSSCSRSVTSCSWLWVGTKLKINNWWMFCSTADKIYPNPSDRKALMTLPQRKWTMKVFSKQLKYWLHGFLVNLWTITSIAPTYNTSQGHGMTILPSIKIWYNQIPSPSLLTHIHTTPCVHTHMYMYMHT